MQEMFLYIAVMFTKLLANQHVATSLQRLTWHSRSKDEISQLASWLSWHMHSSWPYYSNMSRCTRLALLAVVLKWQLHTCSQTPLLGRHAALSAISNTINKPAWQVFRQCCGAE
jgi:hypothetical protein